MRYTSSTGCRFVYLHNPKILRNFALAFSLVENKPIVQLTQNKAVAVRLVYIILWSAGLLWATFPEVISGNYNFNLIGLKADVLRSNYTFPLITVLALYLWDVIYELAKEKAETGVIRGDELIYVFISLVVFLLCYLISISVSNPNSASILFAIIWCSMTAMKISTTKQINVKPLRVPQGTSISDN